MKTCKLSLSHHTNAQEIPPAVGMTTLMGRSGLTAKSLRRNGSWRVTRVIVRLFRYAT